MPGGIDFAGRKGNPLDSHRQENLGQPMEEIFKAIRRLVEKAPELELVFPVHFKSAVRRSGYCWPPENMDRVHLILNPWIARPFVNLMARCYLVLTDSGDQEELQAWV